jgi:poly-beta-1,6-N-acetyl-D-glucosamine synthase
MVEIAFWACLLIIFYTYLGYGIILFFLVVLKRGFAHQKTFPQIELPDVTILVAAYNEAAIIEGKVVNTLALDYPDEKIKYLFVTDGSTDGTPDIVLEYPMVELMHQPEREGKIRAVNRAMERVNTPIVVFTDANTLLNKEAIHNIVRHYQDEKVGAVAGEKRILVEKKDRASSAGEGIYWKYESILKNWDSELYSVVGAAGELFSIRTKLFEFIPEDTIIEDFYITLKIAAKGFRVKYEPEAYAMETASQSVKEELKRKIRIAAGGIQAIVRLVPLLNLFKYGTLSFQYVSHRVLRWTLAPLCLPLLFLCNLILSFQSGFYLVVLIIHIMFYLLALIGGILAAKEIKLKAIFVPFYFVVMNYSVFVGFFRYIRGRQSVVWEKARRA